MAGHLCYRYRPVPDAPPAGLLLLDRDGVLNRRIVGGYVTEPAQLEFIFDLVPVMVAAQRAGCLLAMVTNQGCIAQGLATVDQVAAVNQEVVAALAERDAHIDAAYVCPHHPLAVDPSCRVCSCRKPQPGMILAAAADYGVGPEDCYLIGDADSDLQAAAAAGIPAGRIARFVGAGGVPPAASFWWS